VYKKADGVDISVEAAIEKYKLTGRRQYKAKQSNKKLPKPEVKRAKVEAIRDNGVINNVVTEAIQNVLGVEVTVSGRIEIVFGWQKF
jgi:hypothetical protein